MNPPLQQVDGPAAFRADDSRDTGRTPARINGVWTIVAVSTMLLAVAYLMPQDLWETNRLYLALCAVAFMIRTIQPLLAVPLVVVMIVALLRRRKILAMSAVVITAWCGAPALLDCIPARRDHETLPAVRVMSINLNAENTQYPAVQAEIRRVDPDMVAFQEYRQTHDAALRQLLADRYPYVHVASTNAGVAVYSRIPLGLSTLDAFADIDSPARTRVEAQIGGQTIAVYVVHLPRFSSIDSLRQSRVELARLLAYVRADTLPVVLMGDFNFTERTPNAQLIRELGLESASQTCGKGLSVSRPAQFLLVGWLAGIRIDHVFVKAPVIPSSFTIGEDVGSDHLPIIADLAVEQVQPI
jgi:endonuclease/exonuclease/phosphatase (EEP) superfamily protein YafD